MTDNCYITLHILLHLFLRHATATAGGGSWTLIHPNIGISAMHMQLLHTDRVIAFDRTDFGPSNISLPSNHCRVDQNDSALIQDCTAHSIEYDVVSNSIRPLTVLTDTWCSSASVLPDGTLVQTGGYNDGDHVVRMYEPCDDATCDWVEIDDGLVQRRWYSTNHILPDGREIIIGGRRQFNYEFYPKTSMSGVNNLSFLAETNDPGIENNLYPFVFLNKDGNLFIFSNNRAILFDYSNRVVTRKYPALPGGDPRNYPSSGSAVLLPLKEDTGAEVLVCGGAPEGSYASAYNMGVFAPALNTCGRIKVDDPDPNWVMEEMPVGRVMGDMLLLPNGDVLIINGAGSGVAGWELGRDPILTPVSYRPDNALGSRFEVQSSSTRPRMYHSSAVLLRNGRILVGGSNPHTYYNFTGVMFPTDLSLEAFSPSYLDPKHSNLRPKIVYPVSHCKFGYKQEVVVHFNVSTETIDANSINVTMVAPSFTTHSFAMNQRLLVLSGGTVTKLGEYSYQVRVVTPSSGNVAPSGYYLLFVVHQHIPSEGIWIQIM